MAEEKQKEKYLIYLQANFELEAEDEEQAQKAAAPVLNKLIEAHRDIWLKVDSCRVVDKKTGYFITK